jgi:putative ABC transport system permease protein
MNWRDYVRSHLPPLAVSAERESEIVEELAIQLESTYERARAAGAAEPDAVARALAEVPDWQALARTLGRIERTGSPPPAPGAGSGGLMTGIVGDLRFAVRSLRRTPAFTAVSLLTLALGLGMGAAAFSVIDTVLIQPLAFESPDRLVLIHATVPPDARDTNEITYLDAGELARETQAFASLGLVVPYAATATALDPPERIEGYELSPALLETLGVQPALGRAFTMAEGQSGPPSVVILGNGFWRRIGAPADIIGQTLVLDEVPLTVVGVMPADFHVEVFNSRAAVYRPVTPQHFAAGNRAFRAFRAVARLQPGVSIEQANSIAAAVGERLAGEYPQTNRGRTFSLQPLQADVARRVRPALVLIAGLVALVLLIAAVNLMNLLLARAIARGREMAVRSALGAGAWRLARSSLIEGVLLAVAGAAGGIFVARTILTALTTVPGVVLPRLNEIALGWRGVAALGAASLLASIGVAIVPLLVHRRLRDTAALKTGHETTGRFESRLRSLMVAAQTGLAFLLIAATTLLGVSLQRLLSTPSGFDAGVVTMRVSVPAPRYPTRAATARFFTGFVDELAGQGGIQKAGFVSILPLAGNASTMLTVQGREYIAMAERPEVGWQWASPGYFEAMGIPVLRGRGFTSTDLAASTHVTLINETMARLHFGGEDPLGKRVYFGGFPSTGVPEWHEIIGVVGDVRHRSLEAEPDARGYDLFGQHWGRTISLALRTTESLAAAATTVRAVLSRHDPRLAVFAVRSTDDIVNDAVSRRRLLLWLASVFALAGFGVAMLGVYGIVACLVAERQREIGVRVALGATAADIHGLVLSHGLKLVAAGLIAGVIGAVALRRAIESQLFGIEATSIPALAAVAVALLIAAAMPCVVVSRRAVRLDPVRSLRSE